MLRQHVAESTEKAASERVDRKRPLAQESIVGLQHTMRPRSAPPPLESYLSEFFVSNLRRALYRTLFAPTRSGARLPVSARAYKLHGHAYVVWSTRPSLAALSGLVLDVHGARALAFVGGHNIYRTGVIVATVLWLRFV